MKKMIMTILLGATCTLATAQPVFFVHPMDYDNTEAINYSINYFIKSELKNPDTTAQLTAFESLSHAKDRATMDQVINQLCTQDAKHCNYVEIQKEYLQKI